MKDVYRRKREERMEGKKEKIKVRKSIIFFVLFRH